MPDECAMLEPSRIRDRVRVTRVRVLAALALACLAGSPAVAAPAKMFAGFDAASVPAPQATGPRPLARVFDVYITPDSVGLVTPQMVDDDFARFTGILWGQLTRRLRAESGLVATAGEMDSLVQDYERKVRRGWEQLQNMSPRKLANWAMETVLEWKTDSLLFHRYGGRGVFEPPGAVVPLGAYAAFLRDMEERRILEIRGAEVRRRFLDSFTRADAEFDLPPEELRFSRPWWSTMPNGNDVPPPDPALMVARPVEPPHDVGFEPLPEGARFVFEPSRYQLAVHGSTGDRTFVWNVEIRSVCLAGDFNDWSATSWAMRPVGPAGSIFVLERGAAALGGPGQHQFRFVLNGEWWVEPPADARNRKATRPYNEDWNLVVELP